MFQFQGLSLFSVCSHPWPSLDGVDPHAGGRETLILSGVPASREGGLSVLAPPESPPGLLKNPPEELLVYQENIS